MINAIQLDYNIDNFFIPTEDGLLKKFNYDYACSFGFPIICVISERGIRVKTFGAKKYTYEQFKKTGEKTLWLRNLVDDVDIEKSRFLRDIPVEMQNLQYGRNKKDGDIVENDKTYLNFGALSSPRSMRGSRDYHKYIVYDEFNDAFKYLGTDLVSNLLNILSSSTKFGEKRNERKLFLLGNNRTLNHPIFLSLGIAAIEKEITYLYFENGMPMMMLIFPFIDEKERLEIEKNNEENWEFQVAKISGDAEHIYFNMSQLDEINYIYKYFDFSTNYYINKYFNPKLVINKLQLSMSFKVKDQYINIYNIPITHISKLKTKYHIINISLLEKEFKKNHKNIKFELNEFLAKNKSGKLIIHKSVPQSQIEGEYLIDNYNLNEMRRLLSNGLISFENISSKALFYDLLNKKHK